MKNPARAFLWLLLIPLQLIIDFVLLTFGSWLDVRMANPEFPGHPAPGFVLLAMLVAAVFTLIVPLFAVIMTFVRYRRLKKAAQAERMPLQ